MEMLGHLFLQYVLFEILQRCFDNLEVCFNIISVFCAAVDLADKIYRSRQAIISGPPPSRALMRLTTESEPNLRYCFMGIERSSISHFLNPKIWVTRSSFYLVS